VVITYSFAWKITVASVIGVGTTKTFYSVLYFFALPENPQGDED